MSNIYSFFVDLVPLVKVAFWLAEQIRIFSYPPADIRAWDFQGRIFRFNLSLNLFALYVWTKYYILKFFLTELYKEPLVGIPILSKVLRNIINNTAFIINIGTKNKIQPNFDRVFICVTNEEQHAQIKPFMY